MAFLGTLLGGLAGVLKWLGSLLVPYWLGKSRQREKATGEAIERLGDASKAIDRVRDDVVELDKLRERFRKP